MIPYQASECITSLSRICARQDQEKTVFIPEFHKSVLDISNLCCFREKEACQNMLSARKLSLLPWRTVSNDDRMKVVAIGTNSNYSSPGSSHSADVS